MPLDRGPGFAISNGRDADQLNLSLLFEKEYMAGSKAGWVLGGMSQFIAQDQDFFLLSSTSSSGMSLELFLPPRRHMLESNTTGVERNIAMCCMA